MRNGAKSHEDEETRRLFGEGGHASFATLVRSSQRLSRMVCGIMYVYVKGASTLTGSNGMQSSMVAGRFRS